MLQDCPSLIQPQASFTRKDSISEEMVQDGDKLDAEASSILIGFANQDAEDSKRKKYSIYFHHRIKDVILERPISCKETKATLPIKTYNNLHLQKKREQPDPIELLAAAASVIDEGRYKGRFYERREIKLQSRPSLLKKSPNIRHQAKSSGSSDRQDTPEVEIGNRSQSEGTRTFSWQYMSMRQNPRIKRNAMHAYITYMIYTDLAHENTKSDKRRYKEEIQSVITTATTPQTSSMQSKPTGWQTVQPYKLLPRQEQRQDLTASPNGTFIGRPLTDFLFEQRSPALNNGILLPPPYERPIYSD